MQQISRGTTLTRTVDDEVDAGFGLYWMCDVAADVVDSVTFLSSFLLIQLYSRFFLLLRTFIIAIKPDTARHVTVG
jgi:hypothetical protein